MAGSLAQCGAVPTQALDVAALGASTAPWLLALLPVVACREFFTPDVTLPQQCACVKMGSQTSVRFRKKAFSGSVPGKVILTEKPLSTPETCSIKYCLSN